MTFVSFILLPLSLYTHPLSYSFDPPVVFAASTARDLPLFSSSETTSSAESFNCNFDLRASRSPKSNLRPNWTISSNCAVRGRGYPVVRAISGLTANIRLVTAIVNHLASLIYSHGPVEHFLYCLLASHTHPAYWHRSLPWSANTFPLLS